MSGANYVILAQICEGISAREAKCCGRMDKHRDRHRRRQYPIRTDRARGKHDGFPMYVPGFLFQSCGTMMYAVVLPGHLQL